MICVWTLEPAFFVLFHKIYQFTKIYQELLNLLIIGNENTILKISERDTGH